MRASKKNSMSTNRKSTTRFPASHRWTVYVTPKQGRIKDSAGPGAVPYVGPLQTYNQLTTPTNSGPPKLRAWVLQHP